MRKFLFAAALLAAPPAWAGDWAVQPAQSTLGFSGTETGTAFSGTFSKWTGSIAYDPAHPEAAKVHVVIDMGSAATGDTQRDTALPQSDWFAAQKFPQAVFDATGFVSQGGDKFTTAGTLTIRGVAKKVTLPFTLDIANGVATAKGALPLVRTDYGVGQGQWATGDYVGTAVTVNFTLVAKGS